ncbi:methylated-DNA--[protein]-cysteine S-methyltransferase [Nakamurella sp.]|uniref:methylated-DNA--[protein]-cysteine S-methyltransferase n=1 Tax=Nakamurella sp. TaxID=1869182 RepID=UPI003784D17B
MMTVDVESALAGAGPTDRAILAELHGRLATAARDRGLLDISYRTLESPLGSLLLAATPVGLIRIAFAVQGHEQALDELAQRVGPRILADARPLDGAAHELDEYFAGRRRAFDLPLDHRLTSGFRADVLAQLPRIGYGTTASYADVARAAGHPRAVRAVGSACGANPLPIVVPCHRVVRSDGTPGGYAGGAEAKRMLLRLEAGPA